MKAAAAAARRNVCHRLCENVIIIIIIIIYRFLERHKSLGYRSAGGVSIRRTVGIGKS